MECVIFIGIQASGKSTFYKERFFKTHMRINLDMLKTRKRENMYLQTSIETMQRFVVDNTNPTVEERKKYIDACKNKGFKIIGYYFEPDYAESIKRNEQRTGKEYIPEIGIKSVMSKLEVPSYEEGFDEIYSVISSEGTFRIEKQP
ncbi:ATP-binding protein [Paenibacillus polymyxa]|uniref:Bifunctional polynucleotide phosphatase/kinase Polynucleotide kinase-3'-phosphatase n=1 Tax=Paenibacillus polymyxa TaxID=1406 RepID=A0A378Y1E5_PAEPO|nr:AAA family ATPase [Paenibacillus polymyxa]MBE7896900.1 AAA family ATPase [Paenibacillus polymyxa]MBG9767179.1 kinase [Paenibacillus polymyxa]MCC3258892.1 ATP-binding protein [Paenibacillus polymyxa]QPK54142.1 ATP-binding protein [Paenibacillus polymyxa]QPK59232.1 ATP-binding protein [Paenibacillus polymyxa]